MRPGPSLLFTVLLFVPGCPGGEAAVDDDMADDDSGDPADDDVADDDSGDPVDDDDTADCDTETWYTDADGDGYGDPDAHEEFCEDDPPTEGYVQDENDCHDDDATAFPGSHATEVPGDGVDVDCDGLDACRDLNCDGWPDLVFAQTDADGLYQTDSWIYLGSEFGYDESQRWSVATVGGMGVDAADFDGDGYVDLAFASVQDGEDRIIDSLVYYNSASGFADDPIELPTIGCSDPTVADVDSDGWTDIVFSNRFAGGLPTPDNYENDSYVYWGGASGFSEAYRMELPTIGAARSRVRDLDADGYQDLVFINGVMDVFFINESYIYWGSADGWSEGDRDELTSVFPEGMAAEDLDGDGDIDLLFTTWMCLLYCGDSSMIYWNDNGFDNGNRTELAEAVGATDIQVADLDDDGHVDLVVSNGGVDLLGAFAEESWIYWGPAFDAGQRTTLFSTAASEAGVQDLDGDGLLDIVIASHYGPSDGGDEVSQIYWGTASGYSESDMSELPTQHAAGMTVVGSIYP
jgi:hypothetical protein